MINFNGEKTKIFHPIDVWCSPHLITHVETSLATTADIEIIDKVHQALAVKKLQPAEHFVDNGYTSATKIINTQVTHQVELIGPVLSDNSWQGRANQGYDAYSFTLDWENQIATCPQGHQSVRWSPRFNKNKEEQVRICFDLNHCAACLERSKCTKGRIHPRNLTLFAQPVYGKLGSLRQTQETDAFKEKYQKRAGIEGTISQGTRTLGLRQSRYIGLAKTHLQHIATAAAMNIIRLGAWLNGKPIGKTRQSRFMALAGSI